MTGRKDGPTSASAVRAETPPLDPAVARMSHAARRWADDASAPAPASARWGRLQIERARRARLGRARVMAMAVALVLPLLAATAWVARGWLPRRDLRYQLDGAAAMGEGGYIHDVGAGGARLRFTDGTVVDLGAGARAWIVSRGPDGARLRLEAGRARFEVVHRPGARWSVDAGPFAVRVTGTAFDITWDGGDEQLEVNLWRGAVEVRGPLVDSGVTLRPGQRLRVAGRDGKLDLADGVADGGPSRSPPPAPAAAPATTNGGAAVSAPDASAPPSEDEEPTSAPVQAPERSPRPATVGPRVHPARAKKITAAEFGAPADVASWPARVAAGDFRAVLDEARLAGFDRCAAACSIAALSALADAARYGGRAALARDLLLAERARFPDSPPARAAAFLLGRMADDDRAMGRAGGASIGDAIQWYDRYLAESPDGVYGSEALARKMLAVEALADGPRARRLAADYLRRFPTGAYAPQAAALVRRP